jgi:hypothetical protein
MRKTKKLIKKQEYCVIDFDMDCIAYFTVESSPQKAIQSYLLECSEQEPCVNHTIMVIPTKDQQNFLVDKKVIPQNSIVKITCKKEKPKKENK